MLPKGLAPSAVSSSRTGYLDSFVRVKFFKNLLFLWLFRALLALLSSLALLVLDFLPVSESYCRSRSLPDGSFRAAFLSCLPVLVVILQGLRWGKIQCSFCKLYLIRGVFPVCFFDSAGSL